MEIISTVTDAAATDVLTDLTTVKDELGITGSTQDTRLTRYIEEVSAAVRRYCRRSVFAVEGITDTYYFLPGERGPLYLPLSRWPVAELVTLSTSSAVAAGASILPFASVPFGSGSPIVVDPLPVSGLGIDPNSEVSAVAGGDVTLSLPVEEAIPAATPITFGISVHAVDADDVTERLIYDDDYQLDPDTGLLTRLFDGTAMRWATNRRIVARHRAGYATVPLDLEGAVLTLITARQNARARDPMVRSESTEGIDSFTYQSAETAMVALDARLAPFRIYP